MHPKIRHFDLVCKSYKESVFLVHILKLLLDQMVYILFINMYLLSKLFGWHFWVSLP